MSQSNSERIQVKLIKVSQAQISQQKLSKLHIKQTNITHVTLPLFKENKVL